MRQTKPDTPPAVIVIFGASGDLTQRKLVPALHTLACGGPLPQATRVVGVARSPLSDADFRDRLYGGVVEYSRSSPGICEMWPRFADRHSYLAGDYDDPETYRRLAERLAQLDAEAGTTLLDHVPLPARHVHRIRGEINPKGAAADYERMLRSFFAQKPRGKGPEMTGQSHALT
jgi:glucose-6-phosphate 1-dehydrogenase